MFDTLLLVAPWPRVSGFKRGAVVHIPQQVVQAGETHSCQPVAYFMGGCEVALVGRQEIV